MAQDPFDSFDLKRSASIKITVIARQLRSRFDARVAAMGVTRSQWGAIAVISRYAGATQKAIAEQLEITEVSAGRIVDRLVADGLVERRRHEHDGRAHAVHLTEAGHALTGKLQIIASEAEDHAWAGFAENELEIINALLGRLYDNLAARDDCDP